MEVTGIRSAEIDAFYHDLYEKVVKEVGIIAPVEFVPKGISIYTRESENAEYLLLNL